MFCVSVVLDCEVKCICGICFCGAEDEFPHEWTIKISNLRPLNCKLMSSTKHFVVMTYPTTWVDLMGNNTVRKHGYQHAKIINSRCGCGHISAVDFGEVSK